jgi:hypothetical protein
LEVAKVNGKRPNFHRFLGIFLEIRPFSLVFAGFMPRRCDFGRIFPEREELDEREEWQARSHAIPARTARFAEGGAKVRSYAA